MTGSWWLSFMVSYKRSNTNISNKLEALFVFLYLKELRHG